MSQAIVPIAAVTSELPMSAAAMPSAQQRDFGQWLEGAVSGINRDVASADRAVQMLAVGQSDSLPDVMIAIENARTSLSLMLQVRDRLVGAYQDILRMQI